MIFDDKLRNISPFKVTSVDVPSIGRKKDVVRHSREKPCAICDCPTSFILVDESLYMCSSECVGYFFWSMHEHGGQILCWQQPGYCPHEDGLDRACERCGLTETHPTCFKKGEGNDV